LVNSRASMVLIAFDFIPRSMRESNQPRSLGVGDIWNAVGSKAPHRFA
jgi:hypothetical protein